MTRILYLANVRLPTEKAHGIQIMKTCEALVRAGASVELVVPRRHNLLQGDPFSYYNIREQFPIVWLPVIDTVGWGRIGFLLETLSFALGAVRFVQSQPRSTVYSRDESVLAIAWLFGARTLCWESHTGAWNLAARFVVARAKKIVVISNGLKGLYLNKGIDIRKIAVVPDGIDLGSYGILPSKEEARAKLGIAPDGLVALYAGRLDGWKGSQTLFETANYVPEGVRIVIVGGELPSLPSLKRKYPKVIFCGPRPYRELPDVLSAADVLVLPNTGHGPISTRFTSPLKLFAYMAAGKPIVASDLPSIREVLDDSSAFFAYPDDPQDLARAITEAIENPENAAPRAKRAHALAQHYTWDARAALLAREITQPGRE